MKQILLLFAVILSFTLQSMAQVIIPGGTGGGSYNMNIRDEITAEQRAAIIQSLKESEAKLRAESKLHDALRPETTLFQWPLRQAAGFSDNGYYGISNYVDENPAYPNATIDYNCGTRTYDQASGYNHQGTDIFTWPFGWDKMSKNAVEIVAAAPGTILYKSNGNYDMNCAFCATACDWNAVYILQGDGSVAWYGHMKNNSLTTKTTGQTVALGEYLGVVGSSGNSTAPHLHFEVYTNSSYTTLIDPWAGTCNNHGGLTSWWANQQAYRVSTLNKIMTHGAAPGTGNCPGAEAVNSKVNFVNGDVAYFATYFRDQQPGQSAVNTIYRPDNSVYTTWTNNFTATYDASYWYNYYTLPTSAPTGIWRFSSVYLGQTFTTNFAVNTTLPLKLINFQVEKKADKVDLSFSTAAEENFSHFNILRSADGIYYNSIEKIPAKNGFNNQYTFTDNNPLKVNFYKLEMNDKDGTKSYSEIRQVIFGSKGNYMIVTGNPFKNNLLLQIIKPVSKVLVEMRNTNGQMVYSKYYTSLTEGNIQIPAATLTPGAYEIILKNNMEILDRSIVLKQ